MSCTPNVTGSDSDASKKSERLMQTQEVKLRTKRRRSPDSNIDQKLQIFEDKITKMLSSWKSDMDTKFEKFDNTLSDIQTDIEKSVDFMSAQQEEIKQKVECLQQECKANQNHIALLEDHIEDLLRNARNSSIELRNVPHTEKETKEVLSNYLTNMSEKVNAKISCIEIKDIFRIPGKPEANKPIIVELTSTMQKIKLLKAVKTFNSSNRQNRLNAAHLGLRSLSSPVFVAEHLTSKANRLHFLARELTKAGKFKYCWTSSGKVFLRKAEGSPIILVKTEDQIMDLKTQD